MPVAPYVTYPAIPTGVITRQPGSKLKTSREGVAVLNESYVGNFADLLSSPLVVTGSAHPEFPTLWVWTVGVIQGKAGIGTLEVESRGVLGDGLPDPVYALERATHTEPLSTHPLWVTQIAGTPSAPLNGAVFVSTDKTGENFNPAPSAGNPGTFDATTAVFYGWKAGSIFDGIEDYYLAGATWTSTYVDYNPPDLSGVGTLSTPDGPAPNAPTGCFWMFMGGSASQQGSVYRIQKSWLLTGGNQAAAITILYSAP